MCLLHTAGEQSWQSLIVLPTLEDTANRNERVQDEAESQYEHPALRQEDPILQPCHKQSHEDPAIINVRVLRQNQEEPESEPERPALRQEDIILQPCHNQKKLHKKSYIDDLTLLEKLSLTDLVLKSRIIGPLAYHDRFNLTLLPGNSILQHQLVDLVE